MSDVLVLGSPAFVVLKKSYKSSTDAWMLFLLLSEFIIFQYFRGSVDFNLRSSDALFSLIFSQSSFILFTYNFKNIFIIIGFMFIVRSSTSMIKVPCISAVKVKPRLYFAFKFWKDSFLFAECIFWTSFKQVTNTCNNIIHIIYRNVSVAWQLI